MQSSVHPSTAPLRCSAQDDRERSGPPGVFPSAFYLLPSAFVCIPSPDTLVCPMPSRFSPARVLLAAAVCLLAAPPAARAARIDFSEYDLPNGLHVILAPEHSTPVVASYVLYHVGSKDERPDRTGFAHFFEHLMFEGSDNIPRGRLDKLVTGAGGNLNASTSFDQTNFHISLPANQYKLALWIESERMLHGKIEQIGVDTQRLVVKEERRRSYDNQPYGGLFEELAKFVFAGSPYSWVPIGSVQYIDQATLDEFRQFYHTYYLPNNATYVLAGDFDPDQVKKDIEAYFGPIPRGPNPPRPEVKITPQTAPRSEDVLRQTTPLPATLHAWQACTQTDPDSYAVDLLTNIMATGRSSRLYRRMVDQEQAAVEVEAFPFMQEKAGMVGVFAIGNQGVPMPKLDELIDDEIAKVKKDGVTEQEYQKSLNGKQSELASSYSSMLSRAQGLADYHVFYGDTNKVNTELDEYLKVTRDDLKRVANKYLLPQGTDTIHYPVPGQTAPAEPAAGQK